MDAEKPNTNQEAANNNKHTTSQKMEQTPEKPDKSLPQRKTTSSSTSSLGSPGGFEARSADAGRELSLLLSQCAAILSESAVTETAQMKKLHGILEEARSLLSFLKEKKSLLRQRLDVISVKLQD